MLGLSFDTPSGSIRVPPMAVVRCSRGGKTRALYEIANWIKEPSVHREPVAVIYVTFNDFSSLHDNEQDDPLQALCQRIAFAALKKPPLDEDKAASFEDFQSKYYDIRPKDITEWIGNSRAILIIDELNNLTALTAEKSKAAKSFGEFVKRLFLRESGRYFVFSSHVLSTVAAFGEFIDTSQGSERHITLQELPLVDNLSTAMKHLYSNLNGAREAIYYGLLPGMLYEQSRGSSIKGKREKAVRRYNNEVAVGTKDLVFKKILRSLFSGMIDDVPEQLHLLLDGCGEIGSQKIRWVPFHLGYVLERVTLSEESTLSRLSLEIAEICRSIKDADEASGKDGRRCLLFSLS
jgi:hypothetical protein